MSPLSPSATFVASLDNSRTDLHSSLSETLPAIITPSKTIETAAMALAPIPTSSYTEVMAAATTLSTKRKVSVDRMGDPIPNDRYSRLSGAEEWNVHNVGETYPMGDAFMLGHPSRYCQSEQSGSTVVSQQSTNRPMVVLPSIMDATFRRDMEPQLNQKRCANTSDGQVPATYSDEVELKRESGHQ
ncbi:hypothetical protein BSLG_001966 [Batrachochytrium salamandrivorans]|nr:hypothetical protein BSLG_001966 [Batrachochytrium salamandrivorans]